MGIQITDIIQLLSGVALFLYGMTLMGDGLKSVAGNRMEMILWKLSSTPVKGVILGTLVTSVIQSSSATTVMVVGFVNSGMMKLAQAIGIIMGANIGTSITGWILCLSTISGAESGGFTWASLLSTATLSAIIAVVGIILRMFCHSPAKRHFGDILLGFAILMFGMQTMSGSVAGLKGSESFTNLLTMFSNNPLLGILIGIAVTSVLQSNSASVGILQALSVTGAITFSTAFPVIMGMGIGAAVPVLLSAIGANRDGKRTSLIYLCNDLFGTFIWGGLFYLTNIFVNFSFLDSVMSPVTIALVNSVFRILTMLVLAPCIPLLEKLVRTIIRDKVEEKAEDAEIERLEERFIDHPGLAIEQSRIAICSMANHSKQNLSAAIKLLRNYSDDKFSKIQETEAMIDRYEDRLGSYLVKLTSQELMHDQNIEVSKCLHTIGDFERISDHAINISEVAREISEKKLKFSFEGQREMNVLFDAVEEIVSVTVDSFTNTDLERAYRIEPLEELIDSLCDELKLHHIKRVQTGHCTLHQGFVFNDLLTNLERISDHCSNIAVAMIELESDSFDTHEYLSSLKEMKTNSFNRYFDEYSRKYAL